MISRGGGTAASVVNPSSLPDRADPGSCVSNQPTTSPGFLEAAFAHPPAKPTPDIVCAADLLPGEAASSTEPHTRAVADARPFLIPQSVEGGGERPRLVYSERRGHNTVAGWVSECLARAGHVPAPGPRSAAQAETEKTRREGGSDRSRRGHMCTSEISEMPRNKQNPRAERGHRWGDHISRGGERRFCRPICTAARLSGLHVVRMVAVLCVENRRAIKGRLLGTSVRILIM
ncbi:unnamed protein product [Diplocarpon coronariae]